MSLSTQEINPVSQAAVLASEAFVNEAMTGIKLEGALHVQVEEVIRRTYRIAYLDGIKEGLEMAREVVRQEGAAG
jgi:hypothetical protein